MEHKPNKHKKRHKKYYQSNKVGTLGHPNYEDRIAIFERKRYVHCVNYCKEIQRKSVINSGF